MMMICGEDQDISNDMIQTITILSGKLKRKPTKIKKMKNEK